jgi:threonine/homoserine/homoserine lactone efflux protein
MLQSITLISLCAVIAFICFMLYAIIGQKLVNLFAQAKIQQRINQLIGGGFISAGIGLASSNR